MAISESDSRDDTTTSRAASLPAGEDRFRLFVESVVDYGIFMLSPTGFITSWNTGAERVKGYSASEIIGQHFSVFYPADEVAKGKCDRELEVAEHDGRFEEEGWRLRKDGTRFWANVVITPIREADGRLFGFAKVTRDLSERKRHEEERVTLARAEESRRVAEESEARLIALATELRRARDRAEEATRAKDEFLATVSHELRTPLNAILGWSRMLQSGMLTPEKTTHAIQTITRNATAQNQIIDDLLDVSRIITGNLRLNVDVVDVNQVVGGALEVVRPAAEAKGVSLQWLLHTDAGFLRGDASRLQQVFWNLLANAVKFTPQGGSVQVALRRQELSLEVEVTDSGKGIDADFLPRIFDRFSQQDATQSRKTGGLGLGLAIVKHLVELHGGTVEAHSAGGGRGASFVVRLPVVAERQSSSESQRRVSASDDLAFPAEIQGLHVLVVDDERDAGELVQAVLQQGGARVTLASSGAAALDSIRQQKPDIIVSDIGMPGEDGYVFIRALRGLPREDGGHIPAVALTAYARAEDRRKALLAGFQNHVAKPVEPQDLLIVIANLAGRYV